MIGPNPAPHSTRDLDVERRRFVRRVLGTAALIAPLFLALGWWTSRSFLLRETRFNQLGLEVQMPSHAPRGLGLPVRFVTRDPLGRQHRAQVKWVARDAAGGEILRGAVDSLGTHEVLLPGDAADIARLEVRASDGAWGRNATIDVPRGPAPARVELAHFPCGASGADAVLLAQRADAQAERSPAVFVAHDAAGVPIARRSVPWSGAFALARWSARPLEAVPARFELQDSGGEILAQVELSPTPHADATSGAALRAEILDAGNGLHVEAELGASEEAELVWFDAERVLARQMLRGSARHEVDLSAVSPVGARSFVRLVSREGTGLALCELSPPTEGVLRARLARGTSADELDLLLLDLGERPVAGAALSIAVSPASSAPRSRSIDPRALGFFGADAIDRARLGYGQLSVVHSSAAERAIWIAHREREELFARRMVFGTAIALAALCSAIWIFFWIRNRSAAVPPAWRLGFGGTALALIFALVASKLWWGSEIAEVARSSDSSSSAAALEHGPLEAVLPDALASLGASLALAPATDGAGRARFVAPSFAAAARFRVWASTARGLQQVELELPPR
jgi:hypothetical protein